MDNIDSIVLRRQIRLGRYKNQLEYEYRQDMRKVDDKYLVKIRRVLDSMTERDKKAFQMNRKTKRAVQLRTLLDDWTAEYKVALKIPMATGYDEIYKAEKKAIPGKKIQDVDKPPRLIMGKTIPTIAAASAFKFREYTGSNIKQAMADTLDPYLAVAGSRKIGFKDGAVHARDRSAEAHISNSIFAGASDGRTTAYKERGVEKQVWLATLDDRTCVICGSRDGKAFSIEDSPEQPAHTRCRCTYIPDIKTDARRGALVGDDVNKAYTVSGDTTYAKWLSNQSSGVQKEILGKSRYDLYTKGELKITKFVDPQTGRKYTLVDLETLEKEAYSKI